MHLCSTLPSTILFLLGTSRLLLSDPTPNRNDHASSLSFTINDPISTRVDQASDDSIFSADNTPSAIEAVEKLCFQLISVVNDFWLQSGISLESIFFQALNELPD